MIFKLHNQFCEFSFESDKTYCTLYTIALWANPQFHWCFYVYNTQLYTLSWNDSALSTALSVAIMNSFDPIMKYDFLFFSVSEYANIIREWMLFARTNNTFCGWEIRHFLHYCEMSSRFQCSPWNGIHSREWLCYKATFCRFSMRIEEKVCILFVERLKSCNYQCIYNHNGA